MSAKDEAVPSGEFLDESHFEFTEEEKRIIDERLKSMEENPDRGIPCEQAIKTIRKMPNARTLSRKHPTQ